jgi:hypothetical protein
MRTGCLRPRQGIGNEKRPIVSESRKRYEKGRNPLIELALKAKRDNHMWASSRKYVKMFVDE